MAGKAGGKGSPSRAFDYVGPITSDTTIDTPDTIVGVNTGSAAPTVTLADVLHDEVPAFVIISDEAGNASTNAITLSAGAGTIVGIGASVDLNQDDGTVILYSNGTDWHRVGEAQASSSGGLLF